MATNTKWSVPFPGVPDWVPEAEGFWGEGGTDTGWETRRAWLLAHLPDERVRRLLGVVFRGRALPSEEARWDIPEWPDVLPRMRALIACVELRADGLVTEADVVAAKNALDAAVHPNDPRMPPSAIEPDPTVAAAIARFTVGEAGAWAEHLDKTGRPWDGAKVAERRNQSRIFTLATPNGNWDPSWATEEVRTLADEIYWTEAWDRLPATLVPLKRAGCVNAFVLKVLRELPHEVCFKGMWALDACRGVR